MEILKKIVIIIGYKNKIKSYKLFHTVDTVHLRHIKLSYRPTDAH
jgi:hypothetical protein